MSDASQQSRVVMANNHTPETVEHDVFESLSRRNLNVSNVDSIVRVIGELCDGTSINKRMMWAFISTGMNYFKSGEFHDMDTVLASTGDL